MFGFILCNRIEFLQRQADIVKAIHHATLAAPELPDLLEAAAQEDLDHWQRSNLR